MIGKMIKYWDVSNTWWYGMIIEESETFYIVNWIRWGSRNILKTAWQPKYYFYKNVVGRRFEVL